MKEELNGEIKNITEQTRVYFNVYKTSEGLYINEDLCKSFNVGNLSKSKIIKDQTCCLVEEEDLKAINQKTQDSSKILIPNIIKIFDLQLVLSFTVYVDIKHDHKLYILDNTCRQYNIIPRSKRTIHETTYGNVTETDLDQIEKQSATESIKLKRKYIEIELPDEKKPAEDLFLLYIDYQTNKKYVTRKTYELFKQQNIEIEGTPKIIDNKNCYSITETQLQKAEETMNYHSVDCIIKPFIQPLQKIDITQYKEHIDSIVQKIRNLQERNKVFTHIREYDDSKVNDDIRPYLDRIMPVLGDDDQIRKVLGDNDIIKDVIDTTLDHSIIIYKDANTQKTYIPTTEENATITIMNKPCKEVNLEEINQIDNNIVIADVYLTKKQEYTVTICNNNGQLFVSHDMISNLGFYIENPHRIMVNKEIYEEIAPEDIDIIKELESDKMHINIVMKQIAAKRG